MKQSKTYGNGMCVALIKIIEDNIKNGNSFYIID